MALLATEVKGLRSFLLEDRTILFSHRAIWVQIPRLADRTLLKRSIQEFLGFWTPARNLVESLKYIRAQSARIIVGVVVALGPLHSVEMFLTALHYRLDTLCLIVARAR